MEGQQQQQPAGTPGAQRKCQCKLVLLGESGVGKSNLVLQFVQGQFVEHQESTIGAAFLTQTVVLNNTLIKFEIWDTAGQERYRSLAPMYYRGAQAAIVVYDITQNISFEKAKQWVKELKRRATQNIVIALAGNKADLPNRRVTEEEVQAYAEQNNLISFETSAKTGHNVRRLFEELAARLPDTLSAEPPPSNAVNVTAGANQNQEPERAGMCC